MKRHTRETLEIRTMLSASADAHAAAAVIQAGGRQVVAMHTSQKPNAHNSAPNCVGRLLARPAVEISGPIVARARIGSVPASRTDRRRCVLSQIEPLEQRRLLAASPVLHIDMICGYDPTVISLQVDGQSVPSGPAVTTPLEWAPNSIHTLVFTALKWPNLSPPSDNFFGFSPQSGAEVDFLSEVYAGGDPELFNGGNPTFEFPPSSVPNTFAGPFLWDVGDTSTVTVKAVGGASDLSAFFSTQPTSAGGNSTFSPGDSGTAAFNVSNSGSPATGSVSALFQLVPTDGSTNNGQPIDLAGTASASITNDITDPDPIPVNFTVPPDTPPGTYTLTGTLSDGGGITDTDTGDKTFSSSPITVTGGGLQVNIDDTKIVPFYASNLNLNQFFGTEKIQVPVTVTNSSSSTLTGAKLQVFASASRSPAGNPLNGSLRTLPTIPSGATETLMDTITIAANAKGLTIGSPDYFVAEVTPRSANEKPAVGPTAATFEYLGTPRNPKLFAVPGDEANPVADTLGASWFGFLDDFIQGTSALAYEENIQGSGQIDPTDARQVVGLFERDSIYPYLDSVGIPTIGVGIRFDVPGMLQNEIFADVQANYLRDSGKTLARNEVYSTLLAQAKSNPKGVPLQYPLHITPTQDTALFDKREAQNEALVKKKLGAAWSPLMKSAQAAALFDAAHRRPADADYASTLLAKNDGPSGFLVAAFRLSDTPVLVKALANPHRLGGLFARVEYEVQTMLQSAGSLTLSDS